MSSGITGNGSVLAFVAEFEKRQRGLPMIGKPKYRTCSKAHAYFSSRD